MIYLPDTLLYKLDSARIGTAMAVSVVAGLWHRGLASEAELRATIERSIKADADYFAEYRREYPQAKEGEAT